VVVLGAGLSDNEIDVIVIIIVISRDTAMSLTNIILTFIMTCSWLNAEKYIRQIYLRQEAQLSQTDRAAACLNFGKT